MSFFNKSNIIKSFCLENHKEVNGMPSLWLLATLSLAGLDLSDFYLFIFLLLLLLLLFIFFFWGGGIINELRGYFVCSSFLTMLQSITFLSNGYDLSQDIQ